MSKPKPFSPDERAYYEGKLDFDELMRRQSSAPTTYTLKYNAFQTDPFQDAEATTHDLGELIALIDQHVVEDDSCWITVHQDGVETGKGQYYHVVGQPGRVVDGIEEHDAAKGLCERINEIEQAAVERIRGQEATQ